MTDSFFNEKTDRFWTNASVCLIFLFFAAAALIAGINEYVWLDEITGILELRYDIRGMLNLFLAYDVHPPLYFVGQKIITLLFGESVFAMRMFSICGMLLSMIITARWLLREFSAKTAFYFCLYFFATGWFLSFSYEIRSYGWALFFIAGATVCAYYVLSRPCKIRYYAGFALFAAGTAWTNYLAAIVVGTGGIALFVYMIKRQRQKCRVFFLACAGAVLLYLPWILQVKPQFIPLGKPFYTVSYSLFNTANDVLSPFNAGHPIMAIPLFILFACVSILFIQKKEKSQKEYFALSCMVLAAAYMLLGIFVIRLGTARYFSFVYGFFAIFFAVASVRVGAAVRAFSLGALTILCCSTLAFGISYENRKNVEFSKFKNFLTANVARDDIILSTASAGHAKWRLRLLFPANELFDLSTDGAVIRMDKKPFAYYQPGMRNIATADIAAFSACGGWIIISPDDLKDARVSDALAAQDARFYESLQDDNVLLVYRVENPASFLFSYMKARELP